MSDFAQDVLKRETVEKYFDMVYRLALSQTKSKDHADDVVQEVFLRYIKKDRNFESEEHLKAWFIRVTINCVKSFFTTAWYRKTEALTDDIVFETKEHGDVFYATQELPEKYRLVIHLFYYEDMSVEEIAECLNTKQSTIKSQLHRARGLLKEKLERGYDFV